jgi:hypothetical protein
LTKHSRGDGRISGHREESLYSDSGIFLALPDC